MLYIKTSATQGFEWHVGDKPLADIIADLDTPVLQFNVDGHELTWLRRAVAVGEVVADKEYYREVWGVKE